MPYVLVLTQISCDVEAPPYPKARTQTWIDVSVAQHMGSSNKPTSTQLLSHGESVPAPGLL